MTDPRINAEQELVRDFFPTEQSVSAHQQEWDSGVDEALSEPVTRRDFLEAAQAPPEDLPADYQLDPGYSDDWETKDTDWEAEEYADEEAIESAVAEAIANSPDLQALNDNVEALREIERPPTRRLPTKRAPSGGSRRRRADRCRSC